MSKLTIRKARKAFKKRMEIKIVKEFKKEFLDSFINPRLFLSDYDMLPVTTELFVEGKFYHVYN